LQQISWVFCCKVKHPVTSPFHHSVTGLMFPQNWSSDLKLDIPLLLIFSENYSITHYDEQHCHWISVQTTLHLSVAS
jgi:hypothetical protein